MLKIATLTTSLVLALAGCATGPQLTGNVAADTAATQQSLTQALQNLSKFSVTDLQAASADAKAHNDPEAAMCWDGLVPIVQSIGTGGALPAVPKIAGGASLFQAVRDILQGGLAATTGTPVVVKQINMACGPLYVSARADIAKVLIMVGAAAAGGPGVGGAVGSIPAALAPAVNGLLQAAPVR